MRLSVKTLREVDIIRLELLERNEAKASKNKLGWG